MGAEASSNDPRLERVRRAALVEWEAMAPGWERRREYLRDFSKGIADWMVARLDPQPGQTILELGAGTGETGFAAARLIGDSGRLISTDLPPAMVEVAKRRAEELRSFSDEERAAVREATERATEGFRTDQGYDLPGLSVNALAS